MAWHDVALIGSTVLLMLGGQGVAKCAHAIRRACKAKKDRAVNIFRGRVFPDPNDLEWDWDSRYLCFRNGAVGLRESLLKFKDIEIARGYCVKDYYTAVNNNWYRHQEELTESKIEEVLKDLP